MRIIRAGLRPAFAVLVIAHAFAHAVLPARGWMAPDKLAVDFMPFILYAVAVTGFTIAGLGVLDIRPFKSMMRPALVLGRVLDAAGEPIADALLDVWQTAENGMYSGQDPEQPLTNLRGRYRTDAQGRFAIRTTLPVSYPIPTDGPVGRLLQACDRHPWRPAHLHFMVMAPGHRTLVTHLFNHDDPYLESDVVFGVKDDLIAKIEKRNDPVMPDGKPASAPWHLMTYEFHVRPGHGAAPQPLGVRETEVA